MKINRCKNCKLFNENKAKKMFYKHYCDLFDCQLIKERWFCKYFDRR